MNINTVTVITKAIREYPDVNFGITDIMAISGQSRESVRRVFQCLKSVGYLKHSTRKQYAGRNWSINTRRLVVPDAAVSYWVRAHRRPVWLGQDRPGQPTLTLKSGAYLSALTGS